MIKKNNKYQQNSNWTNFVSNSKVSSFELPTEVFSWLKKACNEAKQKGNKANKHLLGHMKEEYHLAASTQQINQTKKWKEIQFVKMNKDFLKFLLQSASSKSFSQYLLDVTCLSEDKPLYLHSLWVNYMKKHEFSPPHTHSGVLSFIIFVKIPYDLKKEEKKFVMDHEYGYNFCTHTSKLAFLNTSSDGKIFIDCVNVDKSFEGKMLMFPSAQMHQVFPFYTNNGYRITVSGNIRLKV